MTGQTWTAKEFGARGDGRTRDTRAIQAAIDHCAQLGGTVRLTPGTYVVAPLRLRSNVTLHLEAGAVLLGTPRIEERVLDGWPAGILYARDERNVAITGRGTIDGNYQHFVDLSRVMPATWFRDFEPGAVRGGQGFAEEPSPDGPVMPGRRPGNLLVFARCEDVLIEGVTITGSSMWTLHCADCTRVVIRDLEVTSDQRSYNNDGLHLTDCRSVRVTGCRITTGDDCIAISGQRGIDTAPLHAASEPEIALGFSDIGGAGEDIAVSDCVLSSKSSAVRIWSLQTAVRNVRLSNLEIRDTNRGIGIFLRSDQSISDIEISDLRVETRLHTGAWWGWAEPIHISAAPLPGTEVEHGRIDRVRVRGLSAVAENGLVVYAHAPGIIGAVSLEDISLEIRRGPHSDLKAGHLDLRNTIAETAITQRTGSGLVAVNVGSLRARRVAIRYGVPIPPYFGPGPQLDHVEDLEIDGWTEWWPGAGLGDLG